LLVSAKHVIVLHGMYICFLFICLFFSRFYVFFSWEKILTEGWKEQGKIWCGDVPETLVSLNWKYRHVFLFKKKHRHVYTSSSEFRMQIAAISSFPSSFGAVIRCFLAHKLELVPTTTCRSIQQHLEKQQSLLLFQKVSALQ
jgi:hypothetical protein